MRRVRLCPHQSKEAIHMFAALSDNELDVIRNMSSRVHIQPLTCTEQYIEVRHDDPAIYEVVVTLTLINDGTIL